MKFHNWTNFFLVPIIIPHTHKHTNYQHHHANPQWSRFSSTWSLAVVRKWVISQTPVESQLGTHFCLLPTFQARTHSQQLSPNDDDDDEEIGKTFRGAVSFVRVVVPSWTAEPSLVRSPRTPLLLSSPSHITQPAAPQMYAPRSIEVRHKQLLESS